MAVKVFAVTPGSLAEKAGLHAGDTLVSLNGHAVTDVLDYRFYETESTVAVRWENPAGEAFEKTLHKSQYERLGMEFQTYLMDAQHSCKNKCVFCFIDQLPKGMRETLYFKDDDDRLSFLFGNYITLTNIDDREIDRIIAMHISPINVSVHTMDPALRCKMMNNRFAGDALRHLRRLAESGVRLNCQIVLCPGLNDGAALEYTLSELYGLGEGLLSVACVPVGLTRYREGLYPLEPFTEETARAAVEILERWGDKFLAERGSRTVYPSDEFYLIAKRELPPVEFYEDFPQIENGVGMLRDFEDEFFFAMEETPAHPVDRKVTIPSGEAAYPFVRALMSKAEARYPGLTVDLIPVHNDFFGGTVDVTGLLVGRDVLAALSKREDLGSAVLIPNAMLMAEEDIFLDDVTVPELSQRLGVPVKRMHKDAAGQLRDILDE